MDPRGNIHELDEARKRMTEAELAELVPIPDEQVDHVSGLSIEDRIRWYEERISEANQRMGLGEQQYPTTVGDAFGDG